MEHGSHDIIYHGHLSRPLHSNHDSKRLHQCSRQWHSITDSNSIHTDSKRDEQLWQLHTEHYSNRIITMERGSNDIINYGNPCRPLHRNYNTRRLYQRSRQWHSITDSNTISTGSKRDQ